MGTVKAVKPQRFFSFVEYYKGCRVSQRYAPNRRVFERFPLLRYDVICFKDEIAGVRGDIGTMKWQIGVLLAIGLGGSASVSA